MAGNGAGERTEKPSAKRIKDAHEKGQIARSQSLTGAVTLGAVTLTLGWFGVQMVSIVAARLASLFGRPLVSRALLMRGLATLARDVALLAPVHRRKSAVFFRHWHPPG